MLSLDHISLSGSAVELERLGFLVTTTAGAHGQHARVMLDRSYLELQRGGAVVPNLQISQVNDGGSSGSCSSRLSTGEDAPPLRAGGWFVRSDDQDALFRHLQTIGLNVSAPEPYAGHDGEWLDLKLPGPTAVTPIVTRRLDRDDWPPALSDPHPNGATRITGLRLTAQRPRGLIDVLTAAGAQNTGDGRVALTDAELVIRGGEFDALTAVVLADRKGNELVLELTNGRD